MATYIYDRASGTYRQSDQTSTGNPPPGWNGPTTTNPNPGPVPIGGSPTVPTYRIPSTPSPTVTGGAPGGGPITNPYQSAYAPAPGPLSNLATDYANRPAPTYTPTSVSPLQTSAGVTIAPNERAVNPTLAPAAQAANVKIAALVKAGHVKIGPAGVAAVTKVGAAELAKISAEFRGMQMETAQHFGRLMRGEDSIATLQANRMRDQIMASQRSMAASARPGQGALAQRVAAQNMGRAQQDLAGRTLEAQLAERNAAGQLLSQLATSARGQDEQLSMFNADQRNQNSRLNAQLGTNVSIANAANVTQRNIAQGQADVDINTANANNANNINIEQGRINRDINTFNANAVNTNRNLLFSEGAATARHNATETNTTNRKQGEFNLNNNQFNVGQANTRGIDEAKIRQGDSQFGVNTQLENRRINDAASGGVLQIQVDMAQLDQNGKIAYQELLKDERFTKLDAATRIKVAEIAAAAAMAGKPGTFEKIMAGLNAGLSATAILASLGVFSGGGGGGDMAGTGQRFVEGAGTGMADPSDLRPGPLPLPGDTQIDGTDRNSDYRL